MLYIFRVVPSPICYLNVKFQGSKVRSNYILHLNLKKA